MTRSCPRRALPAVWVLLSALVACGPSVEDQVAEMAAGDATDETRQALMLAGDRAVAPLLQALQGDVSDAGRRDLVLTLSSLMLRTEGAPIEAALADVLRRDPSPEIRRLVAHQLGLRRRYDTIPALVEALDDADGGVREAALIALGDMRARWQDQEAAIRTRVRQLSTDRHPGTQLEAMILRSAEIQTHLSAARQAALTGDVAGAEQILRRTLADAPGDKRAAYALGKHYVQNGEIPQGQQILRRHGLLLDVPRLSAAPTIDGHVQPGEWAEAAHTDSFVQLSSAHEAALPARQRTDLYLGWRAEGVYVAMVCWDDSTQDLVIKATVDDDNTGGVWQEDRVGFFWDADMDPAFYVQHAVNPGGIHTDALYKAGQNGGDPSFDIDGRWGASIDEDRWTAELFMAFDAQNPRPEPGDMWAANFFRSYRATEFSQWVRTSGSAMRPDQLGFLVFRP